MTDRERIMYAVIGELSSSNIPLVFKGGLITKLILQENDYFTIERYTKDIDANWIETPPDMNELALSIQASVDKISSEYKVKAVREYGVNRSAGIAIVSKATDRTVFTMDIDMKPFLGSKLYGVDNILIKGVLANEIIADKLFIVSGDNIYKHRAKDIIDLFSLSHCCEINTIEIISLLNQTSRTINSFDGFLNHKSELAHAYNKLKGIDGKPPFDEIYHYLNIFIKPFMENNLANLIWNPEKTVWQKPYFIEVTHQEAEQLSSAGIKLHGKLYGKDKSVVAIRESNKERAETILAQMRNHKGLKK